MARKGAVGITHSTPMPSERLTCGGLVTAEQQ
jgi:hypothetical protein